MHIGLSSVIGMVHMVDPTSDSGAMAEILPNGALAESDVRRIGRAPNRMLAEPDERRIGRA
jgi:hypothetical protein